jgi:hypothetical protein
LAKIKDEFQLLAESMPQIVWITLLMEWTFI